MTPPPDRPHASFGTIAALSQSDRRKKSVVPVLLVHRPERSRRMADLRNRTGQPSQMD
jgi:hypothetical protein